MEVTAEQLYNMKLHERFAPDNNHSIERVPGGWLYGDLQSTVFVPIDYEFQPKSTVSSTIDF